MEVPEPQAGGAFIGKGTYGCIYSPPLLCKDKAKSSRPDSKKLGKISEWDDVECELLASQILSKVPKNTEYFILPEIDSLCIPKTAAQQKEPEMDKCTPLKEFGEEKMVHYQMRFGGTNLHVRTFTKGIDLTTFPLFEFTGHLLEAAATLVLAGYVHNDIHSKNIVMLNPRKPKLIDFGRSYSAKTITQKTIDSNWTVYSPDYDPEPPEIALMIAAHEEVPIPQCLHEMKWEKDSLRLLERLFGMKREAQISDLQKFWSSSKAAKQADWVAFWKLYWPVFDAWSIGIILLNLYNRFQLIPSVIESDAWSKKIPVFEQVLKGLLQISPRRRLDAVEALALFDPTNPIIAKGAGQTWLEARQKQVKI